MHPRMLGVVVAIALTFGIVAVAYAPYHTQQPLQPAASTSGAFKAQAKVASTHAGFASDGSSMSYVKEHLGHVLACIEGAKGKNVNSSWMNPCSGQGGGVLNDLKASKSGATWTLVAQSADSLALAGIESTALADAKNAAKGVSELMRLVAESK